MYVSKSFSFLATTFFFLSFFCSSSFAQPTTKPTPSSKTTSPSKSPVPPNPQPTGLPPVPPNPQPAGLRIEELSSTEAQKRMLLQENLKLDPRTQKEMGFALPPKDCNRACMETIAAVLYNSGTRFRRAGYRSMARFYMEYILLYYGSTRYARLAQLTLLQWQTQKESYKRIKRGLPQQDNGLDQRGRLEFIVTTSLYGVYLGAMMPFAFVSATSPGGAWVGLSLITFTGAALASSILGTMNSEMTPGQASAASVGFGWGLLTGGLLFLGLSAKSTVQSNDIFKFLFLGPLLGYTAGLIIPRFARPTAGQVAFGSSMGAWLAAYAGMIWGMVISTNSQAGSEPWGLIIPVLLGAHGGLFGGIFLQRLLDWSRSRTMLLNLGGFLGMTLGGGVFSIASIGSSFSVVAFLITMMLSSMAGMALAGLFTNKMASESDEEKRYTASLGAIVNYNNGHWGAGIPVPMVSTDPTAPGSNRVQIHLPLLRGRW